MSFKKHGILLVLALSIGASQAIAQDGTSTPFKLNAEQKDYLPDPAAVPEYSKPQMVGTPMTPTMAPLKHPKVPKAPKLNANIQQTAAPPPPVQQPPRQMMQPQQPVQGVLPPQFLGRWQVLGSRSNVEAQPQYQAGMDSIFAGSTSNMWNIQGSPEQGYMLSTDSGVSTPLMVQTQGNTAILRYQHPIRNTMAQEALVMQLGPNGAQFDGLERISIVKQGEPAPRAKVTYKLIGHRQ